MPSLARSLVGLSLVRGLISSVCDFRAMHDFNYSPFASWLAVWAKFRVRIRRVWLLKAIAKHQFRRLSNADVAHIEYLPGA
jgi:hypothetical protein